MSHSTPRPLVPIELAGIVLHTLDTRRAEAIIIAHALDAAAGNKTQAAKLLGISIRGLRLKLAGGWPRKNPPGIDRRYKTGRKPAALPAKAATCHP